VLKTDVAKLLENARAGRVADTARLVSIVENDEPEAAEVIKATYADTGRAIVVGFTGPPGAGKSTLVSALTAAYKKLFPRVAVVAVDPSSPYTGGAILGDRIRMRERYLDEGVYIRSMANRGHSGGLARATKRVVELLDALGFDVILVETVGVGQQEVEVVRVVDTVCLLTLPGAGDDIQAIKAGVVEVADILVVNKADRPGVNEAVTALTQMLTLGAPRLAWRPLVVKTSATEGTGLDELIKAIDEHRAWAIASGDARKRATDSMHNEVQLLLRERVLRDLNKRIDAEKLEQVIAQVIDKKLNPYGAVDALLGNSSII
jgi:LAO/AO transport system kinase